MIITSLAAFEKQQRALGKSDNTVKAYVQSVEIFLSEYDSVTKENLEAFRDKHLLDSSQNTVKNRIIALNTYCDYLGMPECKVENIKGRESRKEAAVLTMDEYNSLLDSLKKDDKLKVYWIVRILAATGMKPEELVSMTKDDIKAGKTVTIMNGSEKETVIPESILTEGASFFSSAPDDNIFTNRFHDKMDSRAVSKMLKKVALGCGIDSSKLTATALRDFYITNYLSASPGDTKGLRESLGIKRIASPELYKDTEKEINNE